MQNKQRGGLLNIALKCVAPTSATHCIIAKYGILKRKGMLLKLQFAITQNVANEY